MQQESVNGHVGLRGIAALTVFMFHFHFDQEFDGGFAGFVGNLCNWGPTAVDLFFVLSGFILFHAYFIGGRIDWRSFFVARFARVVPFPPQSA